MARFQILPAEPKFYEWFDKAAAVLLEAAEELVELTSRFDHVESRVAQISEMEHRGDFIVHEVIDLLNRTFVLPLDREDILSLISQTDDVIDAIDAAADSLLLYQVAQPTSCAAEMARVIYQGAREAHAAVLLLRDHKAIDRIRQHAVEINRLENENDRLYRAGIAALVERPDETFELFRWKAIYDALEEASDQLEDVADVLQNIAMKNG